MKTYYKIVEDGIYSYMKKVELNESNIIKSDWDSTKKYYKGMEVFSTFSEAKSELISMLKSRKDDYNTALKEMRNIKKSDI